MKNKLNTNRDTINLLNQISNPCVIYDFSGAYIITDIFTASNELIEYLIN